VLQEKFLKILETYGYWKCKRFIGREGAGAFVRCPGAPIHSCSFIFNDEISCSVYKLPPKFDRKEQRRLDNYSFDYFHKPPINRQRKPST
tara:strand:- start:226 stop:495 length:270 start_codon:yes stop_codon:yes gene_type:complete